MLKHMYGDNSAILSSSEARVLADFARKYNVTRLRKVSEAYLAENFALTHANVFGWAEVAEGIELRLLLAHYMVCHVCNMATTDKKVSKISQPALLQTMDGLAGRGIGWPMIARDFNTSFKDVKSLEDPQNTL